MSNLFIIGNGFDLAHHIKSSYEDFHKFLLDNYGVISQTKFRIPSIYSKKNDCSDIDAANLLLKLITNAEKNKIKWTDFENSLGKLDYSTLFKSFESDTYNTSTVKSLEIAVPKIKQFFITWLKKIDIKSVKAIDSFKRLINPISDYFITFNYTAVLEEIYHAHKVCHVHGDISQNIIVGHGNVAEIKLNLLKNNSLIIKKTPHEVNSFLSYQDLNRIYYQIKSIQKNYTNNFQEVILRNIDGAFYHLKKHNDNDKEKSADNLNADIDFKFKDKIQYLENSLQNIHERLQKDTKSAIKNLIDFLCYDSTNKKIENIFSIGFSYSPIDLKIIQILSFLDAKHWYLNNYINDDIDYFKKVIQNCDFKGKIKIFDFLKNEL